MVNSSIAFSLLFGAIVLSYLSLKGQSIGSIVQSLGLSRDKLTRRNILIGLGIFLAIMALAAAISIFSQITNIQLPTNVNQLLGNTPIYFLIFTFLVAPVNEEILFRGFFVNRPGASLLFMTLIAPFMILAALEGLLSYWYATAFVLILLILFWAYKTHPESPWTGILPAAILFGILHFSYSSVSEVFAAFIFGLIAGYVFKKTESLYPSIIAHMLINLIAVIGILTGAGM